MIDHVPMVRPNCLARPWCRTSHGGTPSPALSIIARPVPNRTSPTMRLARRRAKRGPRAVMIRLVMWCTSSGGPHAFHRVSAAKRNSISGGGGFGGRHLRLETHVPAGQTLAAVAAMDLGLALVTAVDVDGTEPVGCLPWQPPFAV